MVDGILEVGGHGPTVAPIAWCEECGSFECGHVARVERVGRELLLALRRLAESERRAAWWRSQGETDAADRYTAEAHTLREAVREFGGGA